MNTKSASSVRSARTKRTRSACEGCGLARVGRVAAISRRFAIGVSSSSLRTASSRSAAYSATLLRGRVTPSAVWRLALSRSPSTATTRCPAFASVVARFAATNVLPTPPLPPPNGIRRGIPLIGGPSLIPLITSHPLGLRSPSARCARPATPPAAARARKPSPCRHPRFRRRDVQERTPFFVANLCADVCEHRRPARLDRLPLQPQPRLCGRAAALAAIAVDAAAHHVLPGGAAAERARNHV